MRHRTIALVLTGLLLAALALSYAAAYSLTAKAEQVHHNIQIRFGSHGQLWVFLNPCSPYEEGTISVAFQRPVNPPRTRSPDSGTYSILQHELEASFTPLATLPTAPRCE